MPTAQSNPAFERDWYDPLAADACADSTRAMISMQEAHTQAAARRMLAFRTGAQRMKRKWHMRVWCGTCMVCSTLHTVACGCEERIAPQT
eukprot:5268725-Prymnesium_polylepis.1